VNETVPAELSGKVTYKPQDKEESSVGPHGFLIKGANVSVFQEVEEQPKHHDVGLQLRLPKIYRLTAEPETLHVRATVMPHKTLVAGDGFKVCPSDAFDPLEFFAVQGRCRSTGAAPYERPAPKRMTCYITTEVSEVLGRARGVGVAGADRMHDVLHRYTQGGKALGPLALEKQMPNSIQLRNNSTAVLPVGEHLLTCRYTQPGCHGGEKEAQEEKTVRMKVCKPPQTEGLPDVTLHAYSTGLVFGWKYISGEGKERLIKDYTRQLTELLNDIKSKRSGHKGGSSFILTNCTKGREGLMCSSDATRKLSSSFCDRSTCGTKNADTAVAQAFPTNFTVWRANESNVHDLKWNITYSGETNHPTDRAKKVTVSQIQNVELVLLTPYDPPIVLKTTK
jgi:hypothetical protein